MAKTCFNCVFCLGGKCLLTGEEIHLPRNKEACNQLIECENLVDFLAVELLNSFDEERISTKYMESNDIFNAVTGKKTSSFYDIIEDDILFNFIKENIKEIKQLSEEKQVDNDNWEDWEYEL